MIATFEWIKRAASAVQRVALSLARNWWRPAACWAIVGAIAENGIILPYQHGAGLDLTGFALLVTSVAGLYGVRSFEKVRGVA